MPKIKVASFYGTQAHYYKQDSSEIYQSPYRRHVSDRSVFTISHLCLCIFSEML